MQKPNILCSRAKTPVQNETRRLWEGTPLLSLHGSHQKTQTNTTLLSRNMANEHSAPDFGAIGEHPDEPLLARV